jgi:ABC-type dipeptide/oligopeptide/nickel transport system permease subunit
LASGELSATTSTAASAETVRARGPWRQAAARFRRRPLGIAALLLTMAFVVTALLAPRLAPYPGQELFFQFLNDPQGPSFHGSHLLGTDLLGHDELTQMLWAVRETVLGALGCAVAATLIGVPVGAIAGYFGGALDAGIQWLTSLFVTIPALVILIMVVAFESPVPLWAFPATLALYLWIHVARATRGAFLVLRHREFVDAAEAAGASGLRIVFRHLLPNTVGTLLVAGTAVIGQSTVIIATATFFGYGNQQSDRPTLGGLVSNAASGTGLAVVSYPPVPWWLWVIPAVTLALFIVAVYFLADTLDEVLQPVRR